MAKHKVSMMFGLSPELKEAFEAASFEAGVSIAQYARQALASYIEYDLEAEAKPEVDGRGRPRVYETKEARRAAARVRRKAKRELAAKLMADFETEDARAQRAAFAKAVAAKG